MESITRAGTETIEELNQPVTRCMASWGTNECPNPVTNVIVTIHAPGFCAVCEPHFNGFQSITGDYRYLTLEQFESERRRGLYDPRQGGQGG